MEKITAEEARKITAENLGPSIELFVSTLTKKIKMVASEGKNSFDPWLYLGTLRGLLPSTEQKHDIKQHFINAGFDWEDYFDPSDPVLRSGTKLSW